MKKYKVCIPYLIYVDVVVKADNRDDAIDLATQIHDAPSQGIDNSIFLRSASDDRVLEQTIEVCDETFDDIDTEAYEEPNEHNN